MFDLLLDQVMNHLGWSGLGWSGGFVPEYVCSFLRRLGRDVIGVCLLELDLHAIRCKDTGMDSEAPEGG